MADSIRKILEEYRIETREKVFFIVGMLIFLLFLSFIIFNNLDKPSSIYTQTTEVWDLEDGCGGKWT